MHRVRENRFTTNFAVFRLFNLLENLRSRFVLVVLFFGEFVQSLGDVEPVIKRMMASLLEAADVVHKMEKMVVDIDKYEQ